MAQVIGSAHLLQPKRAGFQCRYLPLKPATRPIFSASMIQSIQPNLERTKTHITNLEKLLQLEAKPIQHNTPIEPKPNPKIELIPGPKSNTSKEKALLHGFNLAQIWSDAIHIQANEAAEISPRRLRRLQRLLSKKPEYSPRNLLGPRWREYHGSRDWAGLVDPLDENLRREVVRYGEFIQAAYQSFHSDPATTHDSINSRAEVNLPDKSYKVTKSLYATSSVGMPKWVDDVAPDLGWMTQRSSWVGYVAVCDNEREIARMGRRDIIIALRGTATCLEWAENFRIAQVPMKNNCESDSDSGWTQKDQTKVECGFLSLFQTKGEHVPSLADSVVQEIRTLLEKYKGEALSITITGHSLGAALALLVADEVSACAPEVPPVAVFSFGGPRVGNKPFANRIKDKNVKVLRIVNNQDLITKVPGMFMNEKLEQKLMENMGWAYSHVGAELRVDTKKSPYLKPDADVACCHDLEAYLHLVDGFIASNCPFRENAKRSLVKLLSEQGSNVKKLYMSKSKSFTLKLYTSRSKSFALRIERDGIVSASSDCMPSPSQS